MENLWFILAGLIGGGIIGYIVHTMRKSALRKGNMDEWGMFYVAPGVPAGPDFCRQIAVGAILSEANGFPINTVHPAQSKKGMRAWLSESWSIESAEALEEQLEGMRNNGHSAIFDVLLDLPKESSKDQKLIWLVSEYGNTAESDKELEEFVENAAACVPKLEALGYLGPNGMFPQTTWAWDFGRAVTITRVAYGAGYINEKRAKAIIADFANEARDKFRSWEEFGASYIVGRAIWGGVNHPTFDNMQTINNHLITHKKSPWVMYGWFDIPAQ